jgi:hypothetical protein
MLHAKIYSDEIIQIKSLNSSGKHLFMALCLHTKVAIEERDGKKYRIRKCFPSYAYLMKITGSSRGYVAKGIANLKEHGFLTSQQRVGTSAVFTITTLETSEVHTVETPEVHTVETPEVYTVETPIVHTVETSKVYTVEKHIKNNYQEYKSNNISIDYRQKSIIEKYCKYFGWKGKDYISQLEKQLPPDCIEYFTDELILIGAHQLKRINDGEGPWTGNYVVKGIIRWITGGKGKSKKPNIHLQSLIEKIHSDVLKEKQEKKKKIDPPNIVCENTKEQQEDFDWMVEHNLKTYNKYPSGHNRDLLVQMLDSKYCHDLHIQKIKSVIGG